MQAGACLVLIVMACEMSTSRGTPCLDLSASLMSLPGEAAPQEASSSSAPRGLAPREGLECCLMKTGRTGPLVSDAAGRRQASLGNPVPKMSIGGG